LERRVRSAAAHLADVARRRIEDGVDRAGDRALREGVEGPAIAIRALRCRPAVPAPGEIGDAFGKRRVDARAADPLVEEPGGEKGAVADHLRGQAKARSAREEAILRVARQELGRRVRALPVGRRENDRPQEALESVARLAELDREMIEELGMARQRAADAEVARRLDDPATEEGLPDAVRDDAREERISLIDDPAREAETVSRRAVGKRMEEL